ncbi:hypothetical protein BST95_10680 [Halioglobus japonicus]|nr:hypothetical protein BST95_10680 [Halioglobus japonicus]GHD11721.1 hypothetical protein GCM10007052_11790 [Halioglobus japonicus]
MGTPGGIMEHLRKETLSLAWVNTVVLDEADRMLDMGFADDIASIVDMTPASRQTLLFSAIYPNGIERLSRKCQKFSQQIRVAKTVESAKIVQRFFITDKLSEAALPEQLNHLDKVVSIWRTTLKYGEVRLH